MIKKVTCMLALGATLAVATAATASPVTLENPFTPASGNGPALGADPLLTFSFLGDLGDVTVTGSLSAVYAGGGNQYDVTGGVANVISPDYVGTVTLLGPSGTVVYSPSAYFIVDNEVYDPGTPGNSVDNDGLLFTPSPASPPTEINIFGNNSPSGYQYYDNLGFTEFGTFTLEPQLTAVPLPSASAIGFGMLAGFGALFLARKRMRRQTDIA